MKPVLILVVLLSGACAHAPPAQDVPAPAAALGTGLFPVAAEAATTAALPSAGEAHVHVIFMPTSEAGAPPATPRHLLLDEAHRLTLVPRQTAERPRDGRDHLHIALPAGQTGALERFSRANLGQAVAIVVDGRVFGVHRMKSVLTGGGFQVSWCGPSACKVLHVALDGAAP